MPRAEQLTDDELVRLIAIAVRDLGVRELRFTGGEPLLRRGLVGHRSPRRPRSGPARTSR